MTDRSPDRLLDAWMDLGPTAAPARVADAVRLEVRSTRQTAIRLWWSPRRFPEMNNMVRVGLVAAAVVAAALVGVTYLVTPNVGGPAPSSASPDMQSQAAESIPPLNAGAGRLAPGPYVISQVGSMEITITVPSGWESNALPAMVWSIENEKATVAYMTVNDVFVDPCDSRQGLVGVGPTVDDLVEAVAAFPSVTVDAQEDVTISGYSGVRLDITGTDPGCDEAVDTVFVNSSPGDVDRPAPDENAALDRMYILDVQGERLVISAAVPERADGRRTAEVESILDSTTIEVP